MRERGDVGSNFDPGSPAIYTPTTDAELPQSQTWPNLGQSQAPLTRP